MDPAGEMNDETEEAMELPRCGLADVDRTGFTINSEGMENFRAKRSKRQSNTKQNPLFLY